HEDPNVAESGGAVLDSIQLSLELRSLAAEGVEQPREHLIRIRPAHVHVMEPQQFWILRDLDPRAPWIFDKRDPEQVWDLAHWCHQFYAGALELPHLGVEIGHGETDVVDGASGAGLRVGLAQEHEPRAAEHQPIWRFGDAAAA